MLALSGCDAVFRLSTVAPPLDAPVDTPIATGWKETTAGLNYSCGIRADDTLWCWGGNELGELGVGMESAIVERPTRVGSRLYRSVHAKHTHTCALGLDGSLACWGNNTTGQVGTGGGGLVRSPFTHSGTWKRVSPGAFATCAIRSDDTLWCWGYNLWGELGLGTTTPTPIPTRVGSSTWREIDVGFYHACGVQTNGTAWCWGNNAYGPVGDGTTGPNKLEPTLVSSDVLWRFIVAGAHSTCGITVEGKLRCWGYAIRGAVGGGNETNTATPQTVLVDGSDASDWLSLAFDNRHVCGIREDGSRWCWGENARSELGVMLADGSGYSTTPVRATSLASWRRVDTGGAHTCGIDTDNQLACWGLDSRGQLGDGARARSVPAQMPGTLMQIDAGNLVTCGVTMTGGVVCSGYNVHGGLGDGTKDHRDVMTPVATEISGWTYVTTGLFHTCGLAGGDAYCWGANHYGQLGVGAGVARTTPSLTATSQYAISASDHTCALETTTNTIRCWGFNDQGQVGNNTMTNQSTPAVAGSGLAIDVGGAHSCTVAAANTAYCWGRNVEGQLGNGTTTSSATPVQVTQTMTMGLSSIATGRSHTCAITNTGRLWCWGANANGQLGLGNQVPTTQPQAVGTATWKQISLGGNQTCGIQSDDTLWCWGYGARGQLGLGTYFDRLVPSQVTQDQDWASVSVGTDHACARKTSNTYWCWGGNDAGQLPEGNAWTPTPVFVP